MSNNEHAKAFTTHNTISKLLLIGYNQYNNQVWFLTYVFVDCLGLPDEISDIFFLRAS